MRRIKLMASTAATAALFPQAVIAQVPLIQLEELVTVIENGDVEGFVEVDSTVEYLPNWKSTLLPAEEVFPLFAGCKADDLETANRSHSMTLLRFTCPGRTPPGPCTTGDLYLMVKSDIYGMQIAVAEYPVSPREKSECRTPAPPPSPPKEGS